MEKKEWYIVEYAGDGYDCCGCKIQPIRIDNDIAEKYHLGKKYFKMPCPLCGKVGTWKRCSWSVGHEDELYYHNGPISIYNLPDMTKAALEMEIKELTDRIVVEQKWIFNSGKEINEITHLLARM